MKGHLGKHNLPPIKFSREVPVEIDEKAEPGTDGNIKAGDRILVDIFDGEKFVDIVGISKGRGFAGVVRRHHFAGGPKSHGSMFQITGSIGSSAFPSRVFKGMRMSGHMGEDRVTSSQPARAGYRERRQFVDRGRQRARPEWRISGDYQGQEATQRAPWICRICDCRSVEGRQARAKRLSRGSGIKTMANIDIHNLSGAKVGTLELADEIFGAVNEDLLWEAVKHYRAAQRAGTHATKNKKLVSGAGKKLWKQKGTGRARVGSIRSPLWRHGGTVHGPQPRSYDYTFPRKKLLGALRSALASKFADGKLIIVNTFEMKEPKTKLFARRSTS